VTVTGERVVTAAGGFNPTWQRHVAAYALCAPMLGPGQVLDLGCGIGHSHELLAPRESVGVDVDPAVLVGQPRDTVVADMRQLPFASGRFPSVLAVHSIEHVPDPIVALREIARVLDSDGTAILVTPNRLTFANPTEVIDPYHYVEFDAILLTALCGEAFGSVECKGLFGSPAYLAIVADERRKLDALLRRDPLRLRRMFPRRLRQRLYDRLLTRARRFEDPRAAAITMADFRLGDDPLAEALDLVAVCRLPRRR
jgi:SAM-dependent methyltransferase